MDLILGLSEPLLDTLRRTFLQNRGLDLTEFVEALQDVLLPPPPDASASPAAAAAYASLQLSTAVRGEDAFSQIDINGDGTLEWEELMAALLDSAGASVSVRETRGVGGSYVWREVEPAGGVREGAARPSAVLGGDAPLQSMRCVRLVPELAVVCASEAGSGCLRLFEALAPEAPAESGMPPLGALHTAVTGCTEGGDVLDIAYEPRTATLILCVSDFSVQFWDCSPLTTRERRRQMQPHARRVGQRKGGGEEGSEVLMSAALALEGAAALMGAGMSEGGSPAQTGVPPAPVSVAFPPEALAPAGAAWLPRFIARQHTHTPQWGVLCAPAAAAAAVPASLRPRDAPAEGSGIDSGVVCCLLLTHGAGPEVSVWDVALCRGSLRDVEVRCALRATLRAHGDSPMMGLVSLPDVGFVASAGMDGCLCLWGVGGALESGGRRRGINDDATPPQQAMAAATGVYLHTKHAGVHERGVRTMLYLASAAVLLSAGFEGWIQVYDMATEDARAGVPTLRLEGHACAVVALASLEPSELRYDGALAKRVGAGSEAAQAALLAQRRACPHWAQFLSADERGSIRWWDLAGDVGGGAGGGRCLREWRPDCVALGGQPFRARGLVTLRAPFHSGEVGGEGGAGARGSAARGAAAATGSEGAALASPPTGGGAVVLLQGPRQILFEAQRVLEDVDALSAAGALYHDLSVALIAVVQRDVRVLAAETGALLRVHRAVLPSDACAGSVALDGRRRKLLVGCAGGQSVVLNAFTGKPLKLLPSHTRDVVGLIYVPPDNTVITAGAEGALHVCDELEDGEVDEGSHNGGGAGDDVGGGEDGGVQSGARGALLRAVTAAHGPGVPIAALAFNFDLSTIATGAGGGGGGDVRLWDYQTLAPLGAPLRSHGADITALAFLPPYPALASADSSGAVHIWHVPRGPGGAPKAHSLIAVFALTAAGPEAGLPQALPLQSAPAARPLPAAAQADLQRVLQRAGLLPSGSRSDASAQLRAQVALANAAADASDPRGSRDGAMVTCMACVEAPGGGEEDTCAAPRFPCLAIGDEGGRVTLMPLEPLLLAQALRLDVEGGGCPQFCAEPPGALPGAWLRLRAAVERMAPGKTLPSLSTYDPRRPALPPQAGACQDAQPASAQPLMAVLAGTQLVASASVCAHAAAPTQRHRAGGGGDRAAAAAALRAAGGSELPPPPLEAPAPTPVRSISACYSRELRCLVSTGSDGRIAVLSLEGRLLGTAGLAGRPPTKPLSGGGGPMALAYVNPGSSARVGTPGEGSARAGTPGGGSRAGTPGGGGLRAATPGRGTRSGTPGRGSSTGGFPPPPLEGPAASADEGALMQSSCCARDAWAIPVDTATRERCLADSARAIMQRIGDARARCARVQQALAAGATPDGGALDLDEVKEFDRRRRRSTVVAAAEWREEADRLAQTRSAVMAAARRLSVSSGGGAGGGAPLKQRYRAIGQLLREKTYDESPQELAVSAARRAAALAQGAAGGAPPPQRPPSGVAGADGRGSALPEDAALLAQQARDEDSEGGRADAVPGAPPSRRSGGGGASDSSDASASSAPFAALSAAHLAQRGRELRAAERLRAAAEGEMPTVHLPRGVSIEDPVRSARAAAQAHWESAQYPQMHAQRRRSLVEGPQARRLAREAQVHQGAAEEEEAPLREGGAWPPRGARGALSPAAAAPARSGSVAGARRRHSIAGSLTAAAGGWDGGSACAVPHCDGGGPPAPPGGTAPSALLQRRRNSSHAAAMEHLQAALHGGSAGGSPPPGGVAAGLASLSREARIAALASRYAPPPAGGAPPGEGGRSLRRCRSRAGERSKQLRSLDVQGLLAPRQSVFERDAAARAATSAATAAALAGLLPGAAAPQAARRRFWYAPVVEGGGLELAAEAAASAPAGPQQPVIRDTVGVVLAALHWKSSALGAADGGGPAAQAAGGSPAGRRSAAASDQLRAAEYLRLARRRRIGGEPRRDVLTFRSMLERIDRGGSGEISFAQFCLELASNASGVKHMQRTLEGMFRAVDTDGSGTLSLLEFAAVMFPRANATQLTEVRRRKSEARSGSASGAAPGHSAPPPLPLPHLRSCASAPTTAPRPPRCCPRARSATAPRPWSSCTRCSTSTTRTGVAPSTAQSCTAASRTSSRRYSPSTRAPSAPAASRGSARTRRPSSVRSRRAWRAWRSSRSRTSRGSWGRISQDDDLRGSARHSRAPFGAKAHPPATPCASSPSRSSHAPPPSSWSRAQTRRRVAEESGLVGGNG